MPRKYSRKERALDNALRERARAIDAVRKAQRALQGSREQKAFIQASRTLHRASAALGRARAKLDAKLDTGPLGSDLPVSPPPAPEPGA
jgi:hypothetical protein